MRLHLASLIALAASAQAAYLPITPQSEARHLANQASPMGQAGEARAFAAHHVMPRSGSVGHGGAVLRKVRRLKRGRTCRPNPSGGSAFVSATATPTSHSTLVDSDHDRHHKSKTKSDGESSSNSQTATAGWSASSTKTGNEWDSWLTATDEESAKPTASSTGDQWSEPSSSSSASKSQSSSASEGGEWSPSETSSSSAQPTETGSGGGNESSNNKVPGDSNDGLFPVEGFKLFTTAKKSSSSVPGWQLNADAPSDDYDPKTCELNCAKTGG